MCNIILGNVQIGLNIYHVSLEKGIPVRIIYLNQVSPFIFMLSVILYNNINVCDYY